MMDDRLGERLEQAARDYHRPPATPREELWARIQAERARRRAAPRVLVLRPWLRWGLAAAAVPRPRAAIGRPTAPPTPALSAAPADPPYPVAPPQDLTPTQAL